MKGNRFLLDCTLRDGGYINDWNFGHDNIVNIFSRLVNSGVDFIEVGFLDERRILDFDRTIMPNTDSVNIIFNNLGKKNSLVVGMIDFGTCSLQNIKPCNEAFLDGIRVIFKKDKMYSAMQFCRDLKKLGYKVFSQMVSISVYSDDELISFSKLANDVKPFAVSMVDTYGVLNPSDLMHIISILDTNLDKDIVLGFHAHNNFQLGYINAVTLLDYKTERDVLVDGTLYGMGKSAGNAPLELISLYMNDHFNKNYKVSEMQEAIVSSILDFQNISPWGYQLFYYIAASNKVHPNYVSYLMDKKTLSISSINEILSNIPTEMKLEKNISLLERLYQEYQEERCNDSEDLKKLNKEIGDRVILVIGPGTTITSYEKNILSFIDNFNPIVISINFILNNFKIDYVFFTNNIRFVQASTILSEKPNIKILASSNLKESSHSFDYMVNYSGLIDKNAEFPDNSMCMLLKVLSKCSYRKIYLAGLDGYSPDSINYYDAKKEYSFIHDKADVLNNYVSNYLKQISSIMDISFLTPSKYSVNSIYEAL